MSAWRKAGVASLALCWLSACETKTVVLFGVPGTSTAGAGAYAGVGTTAGMTGTPPTAGLGGSDPGTGTDTGEGGASAAPIDCTDGSDCPEGWTCEKKTCSAAQGLCIPRPVCFDRAPNLVCGCDGITYWNDCLRQQLGASANGTGECGANARRCWMSSDCGTGFQCGHLFVTGNMPGDLCGGGPDGAHNPMGSQQGMPEPPGTCWALPDSCDASVDQFRWNECQSPEPQTCADTCTAIRSGRPYMKDSSGTCP